jgi:uncharacterized membrane protein affecting hemolysin expression
MTAPTSGRITRDQSETKIRQLQGHVDETAEAARGPALIVAAGVGLFLLTVSFLLGKRRGRKKTTTIEIRRV